MLDPEFYLETYAIVSGDSVRLQNGRYRDAFVLKNSETVDLENPQNSHGERRSIFVVTVPGLNDWALDAEQQSCKIECDATTEQGTVSSALKRPLDDEEPMESEKRSPTKTIGSTTSNGNGQESIAPSLLSREFLLNSPIADRPSKACIVKVCSFTKFFPRHRKLSQFSQLKNFTEFLDNKISSFRCTVTSINWF